MHCLKTWSIDQSKKRISWRTPTRSRSCCATGSIARFSSERLPVIKLHFRICNAVEDKIRIQSSFFEGLYFILIEILRILSKGLEKIALSHIIAKRKPKDQQRSFLPRVPAIAGFLHSDRATLRPARDAEESKAATRTEDRAISNHSEADADEI